MLNIPELLLIDDDISFCQAVKKYFKAKDIEIMTISDPSAALSVNFEKLSTVFIDIDMPEVSGFDLLKILPDINRPLVIMVSGSSDAMTRIKCLENGADFFLAKPVNIEELSLISSGRKVNKNIIDTNNDIWVLSPLTFSITTPSGHNFGLSSSEFKLIEQLIKSAPEVVNKETLMKASHGDAKLINTYGRALEVMISRLRSRINSDDDIFPVRSMRNLGYMFHGSGAVEK